MPDLDKARADYRAWLKRRLDTAKVEVIPYQTVDSEAVVRRELAGKKPFRGGGEEKGHRDYFVWLAVLDVARRNAEPVVFISNNVRDFGDGDGHLHQDLINDIAQLGLDPARIRWCHNLEEAVETLVKPSWPSNEALLRATQQDSWLKFFRNWLVGSAEARAMMAAVPVRAPKLLPDDQMHEGVATIERVDELAVVDARDLADGEQLIELHATVDARLTVSEKPPEKGGNERTLMLLAYALITIMPYRQRYVLSVELTLSKDSRKVTSASLINIETRGEAQRMGNWVQRSPGGNDGTG